MTKQLYVLISTIDDRILNLENILQNYDENIIYIVSHQINHDLNDEVKIYIEGLGQRQDVNYCSLKGKGVAKNRNNTFLYIEPSGVSSLLKRVSLSI